MDRSFLSQPEVIAASRRFVCVRLTTYENQAEGEFLKAFHVTRSGELENTVFTILSPDARRQLARASRSARQTFGDAARMAATMNRIAGEQGAKDLADGRLPELPAVANVRLAIDVAACDSRPLVVLFAPDDGVRRRLDEDVCRLAWSGAFLGRFIYVRAAATKDLAPVEGGRAEPGLLVVQPDRFGLKGTVLRQAGADVAPEALAKCLREGAALHRPTEESFREHVLAGHELGVFWETLLPVTDPMEQQARERGRKQRPTPP
jgi:hypothetical protein